MVDQAPKFDLFDLLQEPGALYGGELRRPATTVREPVWPEDVQFDVTALPSIPGALMGAEPKDPNWRRTG